MSDLKELAVKEAKRLEQKFGHKAGAIGSTAEKLDVIPTGILALDYALGTGGWPRGQVVEVFGPPDIGKSSVLGFSAIRNAQARGMLCGIVAMEPNFDPQWAYKNGVEPETVVIGRPNNGEEAFAMLHDWVRGDSPVDFILFDSIGAVLKQIEIGDEKKEGKPNQGGQSNLITWGIKAALMPVWKNRKSVMLLNQVRDNMKSPIPGQVESPGGWALKHSATMRVQLKPAGGAIEKGSGENKVMIGQKLVAVVQRNKMNEGSRRRAEFYFYQMNTEDHPLGIDMPEDVRNTAIRTQVIKRAGGYYSHPSFPGEKHQIQSKESVDEFLLENPDAVETIRNDVIHAMLVKEAEARKDNDSEAGD